MPSILYEGAEVREDPALPDADWTADRRETYLLCLDVARPLSVDRSVWSPPRRPDAPRFDALPWITTDDVRARAITTFGAPAGHWVLVALGAVAEDEREASALARDHGITEPLVAPPSWTFLGFDVFDGGISGLVNCGYGPTETSALRQKWASCLNQHGLFADAALALAFRAFTNARVPEHAPFRVVGLWTLPSDGLDVAPPSG
ncbi:MAG: hypothetical protein HOO96_06590 [Polyangiaceae bacterium]|nr:hypothetical protein [Polyangiaceae bacterium]